MRLIPLETGKDVWVHNPLPLGLLELPHDDSGEASGRGIGHPTGIEDG